MAIAKAFNDATPDKWAGPPGYELAPCTRMGEPTSCYPRAWAEMLEWRKPAIP